MPHFVWFGILGLVLLYAAGIITFLVKRKNIVKFRRYHRCWVPEGGELGDPRRVGQPRSRRPLHSTGWVDWAGGHRGSILWVLCGGKGREARDKKWGAIHWKVQLAALVIATCHAAWFMARILGK